MIPMLCYLLLKKLRKQNSSLQGFNIDLQPFIYFIKIMISIVVFMIISLAASDSKGQQLNYKVMHGSDRIGWIKLEKNCDNEQYCRLVLTSETRFRMLMAFNSSITETAYFLKDKMIFSSQYHKLNDNIKANKKTSFNGKGYEVTENNESRQLDIPDVHFNLMCMYFQEPVSISKVYCDKQGSFSDIERTDDGGYKVSFPSGGSNCYYYENGTCTRVRINHRFYSADVILDK